MSSWSWQLHEFTQFIGWMQTWCQMPSDFRPSQPRAANHYAELVIRTVVRICDFQKLADLVCEFFCRLLLSLFTLAIYYYYSAQKLILVLLSHGVLKTSTVYIGWSDITYLWSQCDHHFVGQHVILCVVKWWRFVALFESNWISWFKKMSLLSLSYWESDVYWRQNNKHFAELAPQNGRKQLIWRNYVTDTLCIYSVPKKEDSKPMAVTLLHSLKLLSLLSCCHNDLCGILNSN